ncbi:MAG TPA: glycerol-3-phosphate dehydrogenase, partial [Eubacteriaceae bacterium]|nr:glycerol-3-phosphate dehydrogenase [Eubacteriaceae bacterium]
RDQLQELFSTSSLRTYTNPDLIGVELGGALKNVIALGAGISDGLGYGDNSKAALITRGIVEISRLGKLLGAKSETFAGLSGIGDLIVTCTSMHSRNRRAGILIGQGKTMDEAINQVKMVVEGIKATKASYELSKFYHCEMPIVEGMYKILYENVPPRDMVNEIMTRKHKSELEALDFFHY